MDPISLLTFSHYIKYIYIHSSIYIIIIYSIRIYIYIFQIYHLWKSPTSQLGFEAAAFGGSWPLRYIQDGGGKSQGSGELKWSGECFNCPKWNKHMHIYIYAYLGKYPYLMFMMISYHLCFYRSVQRDPTLLLVWLEGYGKHSWNFTQILTYGRSSSFVLRHFDKYRWHLLVPYWNHGVLSSLRFFAILEHKYIAMAISARSSV